MIGQSLTAKQQDAETQANAETSPAPEKPPTPKVEHGGRDGPEPTRFGDWEKNGRCIDF